MENLNINYLDIKGYDKLSSFAKKVFRVVDRKHFQAVSDKVGWTPVRVIEKRGHLEVYFKNGQWLHYTPNGTWH